MCGNGVRCLGKLAHDLGYVKGDKCSIETLSGIKVLEFTFGDDGKVTGAKVDMGEPELRGELIPSLFGGERVVNAPLNVGGRQYGVTLVSMGNPHCIVFEDPDTVDLPTVGKMFENNPAFPDRINTEFIKVVGQSELKMRVWERGSGETLACGTGACAAAVAAVLNGYCKKSDKITVHLLGGDLIIDWSGDRVFMTGGAELAFVGETEI